MNTILKHLYGVGSATNHVFGIHTSAPIAAWVKAKTPKRFLEYNKKVFPPQAIGEEPRPAVSHFI